MFKKLITIIILLSLITITAFGLTGELSPNSLFYKPGYGEYGEEAYNQYNTYIDIADAAITANATAFDLYYLITQINTQAKMEAIWGVALVNDGDLADYQPLDTALTNLSALTYVSPSFIKLTADDTYAVRTLAEAKEDLDLEIGTDVQAYNVNNAYITDKLSAFAATTSAQLAGVISDEIGAGKARFDTSVTDKNSTATLTVAEAGTILCSAASAYTITYNRSSNTRINISLQENRC